MGMDRQTAQHLTRQALRLTTAAKTALKPADLEAVRKATQRNDHTAARIIVCEKILKDKKLAKAYQAIEDLSSYFGYTPQHLIEVRYEDLDQQRLKKQLQQKLSVEDADAVWGAM
jgi:hypothetical protein